MEHGHDSNAHWKLAHLYVCYWPLAIQDHFSRTVSCLGRMTPFPNKLVAIILKKFLSRLPVLILILVIFQPHSVCDDRSKSSPFINKIFIHSLWCIVVLKPAHHISTDGRTDRYEAILLHKHQNGKIYPWYFRFSYTLTMAMVKIDPK